MNDPLAEVLAGERGIKEARGTVLVGPVNPQALLLRAAIARVHRKGQHNLVCCFTCSLLMGQTLRRGGRGIGRLAG